MRTECVRSQGTTLQAQRDGKCSGLEAEESLMCAGSREEPGWQACREQGGKRGEVRAGQCMQCQNERERMREREKFTAVGGQCWR